MNIKTINLPQKALPLLHECEVLIIGATLAGIAAALKLAEAGERVMIVEPRTYPGTEITASLRAWTSPPQHSDPDLMQELVRVCGTLTSQQKIALNLDCLKIHLEDLVLRAGIKLLYASIPIAIYEQEDSKKCVMVGNKGGRQIIQCMKVLDTSLENITSHLQYSETTASPISCCAAFIIEFDGVSSIAADKISAPSHLGLKDDVFIVHHGYRGAQHLLIECITTHQSATNDALAASGNLIDKSQLAMQAATYLMHLPSFNDAYLAGISYELAEFRERSGHEAIAHNVISISTTYNFYDAISNGERAARQILSMAHPANKHPDLTPPASNRPLPDLDVHEIISPRYQDYVEAPSIDIPIIREVDVLVVGGGSSGATAAYISADQGMNTLLVEMNPGLGGTGTFGGVHSYWFGRRAGFSASLATRVNLAHQRIAHREPQGAVPRWNIEIKAHTLLSDATQAGANILFNALTIASLRDGKKVCGIVVATRYGPVAIKASVVIDASGDADIATYAGAKTTYGAERDHTTMWYALAQFARPGLTRNNFTSAVDVSDIEDYTRAILAGRRRRRDDKMHDHGIYIAPRESRHIHGDVVLTLTDQLLRREWQDTINIAFSNHDIKGHSTSDWLRVGLIPPNLHIEIPYRALLPVELDNIIVVGKAISATHDALPAIRMQSDVENLGGVAGLAASLAIKHNVDFRNIPIQDLQSMLVDAGVLPPSILTRQLQHRTIPKHDLDELVQKVANDKPLYQYADMDINAIYTGDIPLVELCCSREEAITAVNKYLIRAFSDEQLKLAIALALMGSETARPILLRELIERLSTEPLPIRKVHIHHTQLPPDQGAMPEECNWLYALSMVPDVSLFPIWSQLIDQLAETDLDDLRDEMKGVFYYVDSVCRGIEHLGNPAALSMLGRLHSNPIFSNQMCPEGVQIDYFAERQAYLELVIARTMASCGSLKGYNLLVDYLKDNRALLARHALSELRRLSQQDWGYDITSWNNWLETLGDDFAPIPVQPASEIRNYWNHEIFTTTGNSKYETH